MRRLLWLTQPLIRLSTLPLLATFSVQGLQIIPGARSGDGWVVRGWEATFGSGDR